MWREGSKEGVGEKRMKERGRQEKGEKGKGEEGLRRDEGKSGGKGEREGVRGGEGG